jgi:hypothetical protein
MIMMVNPVLVKEPTKDVVVTMTAFPTVLDTKVVVVSTKEAAMDTNTIEEIGPIIVKMATPALIVEEAITEGMVGTMAVLDTMVGTRAVVMKADTARSNNIMLSKGNLQYWAMIH